MVRTAAVASGALLVVSGLGAKTTRAASNLPPPITAYGSRVYEPGPATFTFIASQYNNYDITLSYSTSSVTAIDGTDYYGKKDRTTLKPGSTTVVSVNTINDTIFEEPNEETFNLDVSYVNLEKNETLTATIIDDDKAPVTPTPPVTTTPTPPVKPRPTPTPTPTPVPTPEPTPTPEPVVTEEPKVLAETSPTPTPPSTPTPEAPKRPEFVRSVPDPTEVSTDPIFIAQNILLALLLILLIAFPADMFNATLLAHYEEITGWFGAGKWLDRSRQRMTKLPSALILGSFAGLSAAIYGFLSPDFGLNQTSFVLFAGMFVTMIVVSVIYDVFRSVYLKRRFGIESRLRSQATGLVMASIMVFASRMANFLPGYLYGVFTALIFTKKNPNEKQDGEGLAVATIVLGLVALLAWFAWIPVKELATADNPSLFYLILDAALASLWVAGLGVIVFGLAPLKFFYGETVKAWSNWGWRIIYGTGMVLFVHTVLHPTRGFYGKSNQTTLTAVLTLFIGFGIFSLLFWGYFRYRHLWRHTPDAPIELS